MNILDSVNIPPYSPIRLRAFMRPLAWTVAARRRDKHDTVAVRYQKRSRITYETDLRTVLFILSAFFLEQDAHGRECPKTETNEKQPSVDLVATVAVLIVACSQSLAIQVISARLGFEHRRRYSKVFKYSTPLCVWILIAKVFEYRI
jgi:hypothetical protein